MKVPWNGGIQPKPVTERKGPLWVIGHRGFPTIAPENTLSSFRKAIEAGVDMIEFDVSMTRDGLPVVIHDRKLNRTTTGRGKVRKMMFDSLRFLDAGSWFSREFVAEQVPTLDETLDLMKGKVAANIEIKMEAVTSRFRRGIEEKVIEAVERRGLSENVVVSSFLLRSLRRIKRLRPSIPVALLVPRPPVRDPLTIARRAGVDALHVPAKGLKRKTVDRAREAGVPLRVYTVNEASEMRKFIGWGVDGIFTDRPDRLLRILEET